MIFPLGVEHIPNHFETEAFNCWEAAISRNIYLEEELKTLLFNFNGVTYLYHGPGHNQVNIKKIELSLSENHNSFLPKKSFCFLSEHNMLGLAKGTINPFNIDFLGIKYDMVLICESIFKLAKVYTNDGTTSGTTIFAPKLLLEYYNEASIDFWSVTDNQSKYFSLPEKFLNNDYTQNFSIDSTKIKLMLHPCVWKPTQAAQWFSEIICQIDFSEKLVCDMCCGTGVLGILAGLRGANVICSDLNPHATECAAINGKLNNIKIKSYNGDSFYALDEFYYNKFDIILANVPSLPICGQLNTDPSTAWNENGSSGRHVLDNILKDSKKFLNINGKLIFSSFAHQDWSITESYLNFFWQEWDIVLNKRFKLPDYYQSYTQKWLDSKLILSDENGDLFCEYKIVVATQL